MKITLMRDKDGATTMRTLDINLQIEAMKHETKAQPVTNLRTSIRYASPDYRLDEAKKLAKVIPAATFRKTVNGIQMTRYNGIIQIEDKLNLFQSLFYLCNDIVYTDIV